ncbi:MAG: site-2 protease family protein [Tepidisphaeraceae bacterium]
MPTMFLAAVDFQSPLIWAILIGWILSVVLHEFAHGLVAWLGGDYTIKERGGLTLNPLQYVDPLTSLVLPVVFLMLGGIPLPGGVTYIRRDLLRSRGWETAVALAGPAMNFILFLLCSLPFHPSLGWIDPNLPAVQLQTWQLFLGAMAQLQLTAMLLNLIPIPPLDGFNAISPMLDEETRIKLSTPPISTFAFIAFFVILFSTQAAQKIYEVVEKLELAMRFDPRSVDMMWQSFNLALFGSSR